MKIYDFWSLLNEYEIKVPIIQRDYAQGRGSEFIKEIRKNFLKDIYETLVNDKILNLDFIYGSVRENEKLDSFKRKLFLPLDGQQRLTTLFLLHWYLFWKDGLLEESYEIKEILSGFKYETRISSKEFCKSLVMQDTLSYNSSIKKLSESIKNESWFFNFWEKDPTIASMLTMLDSIHKSFKDTHNLSKRLLSKNKNIRFRFIKLENFGLDDSLYIKMNARGKLLTPFENFKANIEKKLKKIKDEGKLDKDTAERITFKFDREWADLFWIYRDKETNIFDQQFLAFLQTIISYYAFITEENLPKIKLGFNEDYYFSHKIYVEYIDEEFILNLEKILDFFKENFMDKNPYLRPNVIFNDKELFTKIINKESLTNSEYVIFYSYCLYIIKNDEISKEKFESWMRVTSNMGENQIYNRAVDAQNSMKSLLKLVENSNNILEYLSDSKNEIRGFAKGIIEEERLKSKLILRSEDWKDAILKAENHPYFKGQIMFLLDFSKVNLLLELYKIENIDQNKLKEGLKSFKEYYRKSSKVFYPEKLLVDGNRWRRALLTKGEYLLDQRSNQSFVVNTFDRDISWKKLLNNKKRKYVKELIDELEFKDINKELDDIINEYLNENRNDWYYHFIKHPELISTEYLGTNLYIRFNSVEEIYLLKTSRTSGRIREYYTSVLYLELKDKIFSDKIKVTCEETAGRRNPNYLIFSKENENIFIEYKYGWVYKFNEEDNEKRIELEELIDLLEKKNYIKL